MFTLTLDVLENVYEYIFSIPTFLIKITVINFIFYVIWSLKAFLSSKTLIVNESSTMSKILDEMPSIHSGYRPTLWCIPPALNTLVHYLIQKTVQIDYKREVLCYIKFNNF